MKIREYLRQWIDAFKGVGAGFYCGVVTAKRTKLGLFQGFHYSPNEWDYEWFKENGQLMLQDLSPRTGCVQFFVYVDGNFAVYRPIQLYKLVKIRPKQTKAAHDKKSAQ